MSKLLNQGQLDEIKKKLNEPANNQQDELKKQISLNQALKKLKSSFEKSQ